jgi:hypothetical protein
MLREETWRGTGIAHVMAQSEQRAGPYPLPRATPPYTLHSAGRSKLWKGTLRKRSGWTF